MEHILELSEIIKTFPGVIALSDMQFNLKTGEIHAICGENGAGKSTLMKVVTGVEQHDSGCIKINGVECCFANPLDAFRKGISIIYQETSLFEEMTVLENLFLCHELTKKIFGFLPVLDYKTMRAKVYEIFEKLHVKISPDAKVATLGMAQKQMVEIAKALTYNCKILILDEPTASLSNQEVDSLFKIIRVLRDEGVGIVYISHRLEEIFELCDRVTVIRDGKHVSTKNVADTNKDELVADMVGRSMENYYPKSQVDIGNVLLEVKHLSVGILNDVNFNIKKGEIVGFAGLAGSGRTELALTLCGFDHPDSGEIILDGKTVKFKNYRQALKSGLVYVSEDRGKYGLVVDMDISENIVMPQIDALSNLSIISKKKEHKIANKYREEVDIKAPDVDFLVTNLSGGNQQKVSVSKALAMNPKVLILDEPTRGVDVNAKAEILKIISELAVNGLTIFMVSSELPELLGMCDRIYVMKNGTTAGCFSSQEATQEKILNLALAND